MYYLFMLILSWFLSCSISRFNGLCASMLLVAGVSVPGMSASLTYFDSYRRASLPANLFQAQRDYFGAHIYERIDMPDFFHTEWFKLAKQSKI